MFAGIIRCLHNHCSLDVLHLEAPDEDIDEVDEGELDEGAEDGDETEDDEDVHGCRIAYLQCKVFGFSSSCNLMQPEVLFSLQAQLSPLPGCMNLQALTWTMMLMLMLMLYADFIGRGTLQEFLCLVQCARARKKPRRTSLLWSVECT